ncbi:YgfZ/GcvT domain-containing protein [Jonesia quinghaiensis]|uniref:CAF17-like 4Fe-4S cluster assembly/insertion protein YgfZ n=1 Tax=Jonesia quinghaiensis TaxID=262806 RepID=UPI0003F79551|nr:glycine cleavage T C-terminal barrel domain-containing protein [Jonesia quinghaiensis]
MTTQSTTPASPTPHFTSPLLQRHGAVAATGADAGIAWHYGDPTAEQRALARGQAVVDQSHLHIITVSGPDRLTWLHSITSQHLSALPPRTSTELLVMSPQGHLEHAAAVIDDGTTTWLITEAATAQGLTTWLNRMKFAMRVDIADVTDQWAALGEPRDAEATADEPVTWRDPWPNVLDGGTRYGPDISEHPGAERPWRLVIVPRTELAFEVTQRENSGWTLAGTWAAEAARVAAWRPRFSAEVDHRSIPHELDWLRTAVHLNKGCYRGQETIARVHNLGRPPRRLVMLHLDGSGHLLPEPGATVHNGDREIGHITSMARHHELGPVALAVIKRSTPEEDTLTVACDGGDVAAAQDVIVPGHGQAASRPAQRGPTSRLARGAVNLTGPGRPS